MWGRETNVERKVRVLRNRIESLESSNYLLRREINRIHEYLGIELRSYMPMPNKLVKKTEKIDEYSSRITL